MKNSPATPHSVTPNFVAPTRETLRLEIENALRDLGEEMNSDTTLLDAKFPARDSKSSTRYWVRRTPDARFGDFTSNVALKIVSQSKSDLAQRDLVARLVAKLGATNSSSGGVKPHWSAIEERKGFLNFRMNDETLGRTIEAALQQGERFGAGATLKNRRVIVEFVSADPSGPLPFSLARMAAVGDAICRLLELQGASITREFYLNDDETSAKMKLLGESVASHYLTILGQPHEAPEGVLNDAFVRDLAAGIAARDGGAHLLLCDDERAARFAHQAVQAAVAAQRETLQRFGVRFDVWTSEAAMMREGRVATAISHLQERGFISQHGGAQWLQTTKFGDETDRVLVRANGRPTYLASDIAYQVFKNERGFDLMLNVWSGEHRPYVERTRAALSAAGCDAAKFEVLACEGARYLKDGRPVSRGKNGDFWTLDDALEEIDADTLKFHLLRRNADERVAIDDEIARRDNETNPAYAARLLPTRLQTMIAQMQATPSANATPNSNAETTPIEYSISEREVARLVALWPDTAENAALERAPHRVANYLNELADAVRETLKTLRPNASVASLDVLRAAQIVAQNALKVLGLSGAKI